MSGGKGPTLEQTGPLCHHTLIRLLDEPNMRESIVRKHSRPTGSSNFHPRSLTTLTTCFTDENWNWDRCTMSCKPTMLSQYCPKASKEARFVCMRPISRLTTVGSSCKKTRPSERPTLREAMTCASSEPAISQQPSTWLAVQGRPLSALLPPRRGVTQHPWEAGTCTLTTLAHSGCEPTRHTTSLRNGPRALLWPMAHWRARSSTLDYVIHAIAPMARRELQ